MYVERDEVFMECDLKMLKQVFKTLDKSNQLQKQLAYNLDFFFKITNFYIKTLNEEAKKI